MSRNWKRTKRVVSRDDQQVYTRLGTNRYLPSFVVNHYIMGFDVSVHDAFGVTIVQGLLNHRVNVKLSGAR